MVKAKSIWVQPDSSDGERIHKQHRAIPYVAKDKLGSVYVGNKIACSMKYIMGEDGRPMPFEELFTLGENRNADCCKKCLRLEQKEDK